jgi:hypothetical protein
LVSLTSCLWESAKAATAPCLFFTFRYAYSEPNVFVGLEEITVVITALPFRRALCRLRLFLHHSTLDAALKHYAGYIH